MYSFCSGRLGTQKSQEDAHLQVSKSFNSLILSKIFSVMPTVHNVQQKLRSSATSERSLQQSTGLVLQRLILLSHFQIVRLTHMLSWQ